MAGRHVVIGSGINALVAAAMLALKGDRVTVLEREEVLGGLAQTGASTHPGPGLGGGSGFLVAKELGA